MGPGGARRGGRRLLAGPPRGPEPGGAEGQLERPGRGEGTRGDAQLAGQLDADHRGAPAGVPPLQLAGPGHDGVGGGAAAAAVVSRRQAVVAPLPEGPPDLPDGVVRQAEFGGDAGEFLAFEAAADDLVTDGRGDG